MVHGGSNFFWFFFVLFFGEQEMWGIGNLFAFVSASACACSWPLIQGWVGSQCLAFCRFPERAACSVLPLGAFRSLPLLRLV